MRSSHALAARAAAALGATTAAALLAAPVATGADLPQNYAVTLNSTPPVSVDLRGLGPDNLDLVQKYCTLPGFPPAVGVPFPCTDLPITVSDAAQTVTGTARAVSGSRTGTFSLSCDFVLGATTSVRVALGPDFRPKPQDISLTALSGSGPIGCAWSIRFAEGTLSGTAKGTLRLGKVAGRQQVSAAVNLAIAIVAGTGPLTASAGGTGSYVDTYAAPWTPEAATAAAIADPGRLRLVARRAASRAAIVPVVTPLAKGDPRQLRVVAPKGARCTASAKRGARTVKLGSASVRKAGGTATFSGALRTRLTTAGAWSITASCRAGAKALPAAKTTARVAA